MGLFNKFTDKVVNASGRGKGEDYSLDECLTILDMDNNEVPKATIVELTGRSKDSLNYKIFEGQTTIKGKTQVRSIKRYWFVDHTKKGSDYVDEEVALKKLFEAFGETYKGPDDVRARIKGYCEANGIELGDDEEASTEEQSA